ncbi:hypothetical protein DL764_003971 [Monosporascus ibericus]|uniref:2EXR domain-containing protein n=1 Tax=Monosporascus ibericus TaxID=155417 RepID=A0A4Q4TEI7_9PEZI|nr:hypothetical protein DL764_003971 [Monosporascus ibericus]
MEQAQPTQYKDEWTCLNFHMFKDLPPELRIKIWQHAMPEARTVAVESRFAIARNRGPRSLEEALSRTSDENVQDTWRSTTKIPVLLHVNAEARHEALKRYRLSLGAGKAQPRIYVDFSRDTLFFGHAELKPECAKLWASTADLQKVQRLAIVPEGAWRVMRWQNVGMSALERIIFVHEADDVELGPQPQLVEDAREDLAGMETIASARAQDHLEGVAREEGLRQGEAVQESGTSLESCLARCALDPGKKRMQSAREELDTLMKVLPTRWHREPAVSTAVFRQC